MGSSTALVASRGRRVDGFLSPLDELLAGSICGRRYRGRVPRRRHVILGCPPRRDVDVSELGARISTCRSRVLPSVSTWQGEGSCAGTGYAVNSPLSPDRSGSRPPGVSRNSLHGSSLTSTTAPLPHQRRLGDPIRRHCPSHSPQPRPSPPGNAARNSCAATSPMPSGPRSPSTPPCATSSSTGPAEPSVTPPPTGTRPGQPLHPRSAGSSSSTSLSGTGTSTTPRDHGPRRSRHGAATAPCLLKPGPGRRGACRRTTLSCGTASRPATIAPRLSALTSAPTPAGAPLLSLPGTRPEAAVPGRAGACHHPGTSRAT